MSKICPKCRKEKKDERLIACPDCKTPFVDEKELLTNFTKEELKVIATFLLKDWRVYVLAGIVLLIGVSLLYWQVHEQIRTQITAFQISASNQIATAYSNATNQLEIKFENYTQNASNQIDSAYSAVTNEIAYEFQTPKIKQTVESVARNEAKEILDTNIQPVVENFRAEVEGKLETLDDAVKKGNDAVAQLQGYTTFNNTVLAAQDDDRKSFDQLKKWAEDKNYQFSNAAGQAWMTVLDNHSSPISEAGFNVPWKEGIDPSKFSFQELKVDYTGSPLYIRLGLIEYIWNRKDILKRDKMQFLVNVIQTDSSLKVVEYAARYFSIESQDKLKPLAIEQHIEWWNKNKDSIK